MDSDSREFLVGLCNKLSPEQLADAESMFDNLEILAERVWGDEEILIGHIPGLEPHMHGIFMATLGSMEMAAAAGVNPRVALRKQLFHVFMFGYEVGKVQWPLKKIPCEEAHT